jgi:hypothetical protein
MGNDFLPTFKTSLHQGMCPYNDDIELVLQKGSIVDPGKVVSDFLKMSSSTGNAVLDARGSELMEFHGAEPLGPKSVSYQLMLWYVTVYYLSILNDDLAYQIANLPWFYGYLMPPSNVDPTRTAIDVQDASRALCAFGESTVGYRITNESHFAWLCNRRPNNYLFPTRVPVSENRPQLYIPISTSMLYNADPALYISEPSEIPTSNSFLFESLPEFLASRISA